MAMFRVFPLKLVHMFGLVSFFMITSFGEFWVIRKDFFRLFIHQPFCSEPKTAENKFGTRFSPIKALLGVWRVGENSARF